MTLLNRPIQLLIVDDHTLFRRGLTALLTQDERLQVMDQVGDVGAALRSVEQQAPDLILLDNHLPGVRGVDAIPALKKAAPASRILMLTVSEDEADLTAALEAGAEGYLLKTVESDQLCQAIVKVMEGESVVSLEMMTKLVAAFRAKATKPALTDIPVTRVAPEQAAVSQLSAREREVLARIALGESNKLIAHHLSIAETTVKIHVQHILRKLDLTSRVQAAVYAAALDAD